MKEVSIIVPIYNMEAYIRQCLDSLYAQVDDTIEVILVNDGSTDSSPRICAEYIKRYPDTIYINQENGGLSDARNSGIEVATGQYTYFLDGDDWLATNAIRTLYDFAESEHCEMVQGGFYYAFNDHLEYDDRKINIDAKPFVLSKMEAMSQLVKQHYVKNFAWGKLYCTEFVKHTLFRKGVFFEDSFWQHHMIDQVKCYGVIPQPLYFYRQRLDSISGNFSIRQKDLLDGYEQRLLFIRKKYPDLINPMAISLWTMAYTFRESTLIHPDVKIRDKYEHSFLRISEQYDELFNDALRYSLTFLLTKHSPSSARLYTFFKRVYKHFFARRLKRINL